jgi:hypothetical protein
MPTFNFNIRFRDRLFPDAEGEEAANEEEARQRALETAHDLMKTSSSVILDWLACTVEVTDESGQTVLTVPFEEALDGA